MKKIVVMFEKFYDFMSNVIGGGSSYAPNETKWQSMEGLFLLVGIAIGFVVFVLVIDEIGQL